LYVTTSSQQQADPNAAEHRPLQRRELVDLTLGLPVAPDFDDGVTHGRGNRPQFEGELTNTVDPRRMAAGLLVSPEPRPGSTICRFLVGDHRATSEVLHDTE
jgi:hypothetical protein